MSRDSFRPDVLLWLGTQSFGLGLVLDPSFGSRSRNFGTIYEATIFPKRGNSPPPKKNNFQNSGLFGGTLIAALQYFFLIFLEIRDTT